MMRSSCARLTSGPQTSDPGRNTKAGQASQIWTPSRRVARLSCVSQMAMTPLRGCRFALGSWGCCCGTLVEIRATATYGQRIVGQRSMPAGRQRCSDGVRQRIRLEPASVLTLSRYELLSNGFGRRMSAVASPEFDLRLLEVAADGLLADAEALGDVVARHSQRYQPQDCELPRRDGRPIAELPWLVSGHIFEPRRSKSRSSDQKYSQRVRQQVAEDLPRPVGHQPALGDATGERVADAVFQREFIWPTIDADRL